MTNIDWVKEFQGSAVVCDKNGIIIYMNDTACKTFAKYGGSELVGASLFDCHTERSRQILRTMMDERKVNSYTIEKDGVKKLIYQAPWYQDGEYMGFVELGLEIPAGLPHYVRG
ncbi:MAG TPA: PAS domain-containing protein [Methylomusa anaerophila]|uniref:PAS domain-containing protein n=1 Tax=Methylomusa anaerophila TaxID=1930071 RepID=A0A348AI36_9FIRM|nr:PAS domain-containing protein [Methylomusa anaerophila]BBB90734.1 hypothetical protein MAMMFC1_01395 [Methylomusa anaerophila]HML88663.1 PAS domain-containing protein [Methylomusa anaerophila]